MRAGVAALGILAASLPAHLESAGQSSVAPAPAAKALVMAAIRDQVGITMVDADVQFTRVPSLAVPGLVYWWGYYVPPNSFDIYYEPVAGEVGGAVRRLDSTDDWLALAVAAGWRPSSATAAVEGCAEVCARRTADRARQTVRLPG